MLPVRLANRTYAAAHALGLRLIPDAVTAAEGAALLASVARPLQRMRYAPAHFDNAIHGFRELRSRFAEHAEVVARLQQLAAPDATFSKEVHVLDLAATGQILPHLDRCGRMAHMLRGPAQWC